MRKLYIIMSVACLFGMVVGMSYSDEKYYDREVIKQVADWLTQAMRNSDSPLCQFSPHKRNSEIITSILGLPKNLNDAGRK